MKSKASSERVPFRRGSLEEATLQRLTALHSPHVPALTSENQWLRFAVRVLAELTQLSGARNLNLQLGTPGEPSTQLRVLGAPPMELSAGTSEVRLRQGETKLLDQLQRTLDHASRSATLRHALFACRQVCEGVSDGAKIWIERGGALHVLPSLLEIAANMEQAAGGPVVLLGSDVASRAVTTSRSAQLAVFCNIPQLGEIDRVRLCGGRPVDYLSCDALLERLNADSVCLQALLPQRSLFAARNQEGPTPIRVVLEKGREPFAEVARSEPEATAQLRAIYRAPKASGDGDGLSELHSLHSSQRRQPSSARKALGHGR